MKARSRSPRARGAVTTRDRAAHHGAGDLQALDSGDKRTKTQLFTARRCCSPSAVHRATQAFAWGTARSGIGLDVRERAFRSDGLGKLIIVIGTCSRSGASRDLPVFQYHGAEHKAITPTSRRRAERRQRAAEDEAASPLGTRSGDGCAGVDRRVQRARTAHAAARLGRLGDNLLFL